VAERDGDEPVAELLEEPAEEEEEEEEPDDEPEEDEPEEDEPEEDLPEEPDVPPLPARAGALAKASSIEAVVARRAVRSVFMG
jgi:hypothetical protein